MLKNLITYKILYSIAILFMLFYFIISPLLLQATTTKFPKSYQNYSSVPLKEKIGQMIIVGFSGSIMSNELRNYITKDHVGGVILFRDSIDNDKKSNLINPEQLTSLIKNIQDISKIKLFISIDQEGGKVARLRGEQWAINTPSHKSLGESDDLQYIYDQSFQMAATLSSYGINMNFAPVVDVDLNPDNPIIGKYGRSFSSNPYTVSKDAEKFIAGQLDASIIPVIKHFPGHGSAQSDSHLGTVDVTNTYQDDELIPFKEILKSNYRGAIMSAHIFNQKVDPEFPASLSYEFVTKILRENMKFNGVIISDDLKMKAIEDNYSLEQSIVQVINSGSDIILYSNQIGKYHPKVVNDIINIVMKNIKDGKISEQRINESFQRIIDMKKQYLYD